MTTDQILDLIGTSVSAFGLGFLMGYFHITVKKLFDKI